MLSAQTPFSWVFTILSVIILLLEYTQQVDTYDMYYHSAKIFKGHEWWRIVTAIFGHRSRTEALYSLWQFSTRCSALEQADFAGRPLDFLIFCAFGLVAQFAWISHNWEPFVSTGFLSYLDYYWMKRAPDNALVLALIPVPIRAGWLVVIETVMMMTQGMSTTPFIGFVTAHMYFYLKDCLNLRFNRNWFCAPDKANAFVRRGIQAILG